MISTKVEPIERDVALIIDQTLSPAARSKMLADGARQFLAEADATNRQVLGRVPKSRTYVDGTEGAALEAVHPDGVIVREYDLVFDVLQFIGDELRRVSPVRTGRYRASHTLFADGTEVPIGQVVPDAQEYVFLSSVPYARKIEGQSGRSPESPQAPKGVYEVTALKASRLYSNLARIRFDWRAPALNQVSASLPGALQKRIRRETRVPAIVVTIRS